MRKCKCKQCGRDFLENDGDPGIHYSVPAELCLHCEGFNELEDGEYYQGADGEYYKKGESEESQRQKITEEENIKLRKEVYDLRKESQELKPLCELQTAICEWADSIFGKGIGRIPGIMNHLKKEADEVIEDPYDHMEYADCMMLILDAARLAGLSSGDLLKLMKEKLEINKQREWGPMDDDGIVEHIRTTIPKNEQ